MSKASIDLDITVDAPHWAQSLPDAEVICEGVLAVLLECVTDLQFGELSLALVDNLTIQSLNRKYRGKDYPTNVLSFPSLPYSPELPMLGDIVIAYETVQKEAEEKSIDFSHHFSHLFIHGFLHLQGYDHEIQEDAERMESLEISVLDKLNIKNPYEI